MFFAYTHSRSKPFLKFALILCLTLLFLLLFTFLTGGYTNPDPTVYRYTHGYTEKYGSWLSSKLGISGSSHTPMGDNDEDYDGEIPRRTYNIALTERAGHHDEVLGAFLYTLATSPRISNTTVYRNSYRYQFSEIIKPFYPYPSLPADAIFDALNSTFSFNSDTAEVIQRHDALVLSSCDQTLSKMLPSLLASLSLLPEKHDFKILCILHDGGRSSRDLAKIAGPLVERGLVTFVVLNHAVGRMVKESVFELASGSAGDKYEVKEWDRVLVEVFVPIYPAPFGVSRPNSGRNAGGEDYNDEDLESGDMVYEHVKPKKRVLSSVIVQGNIDQNRRDYVSLFRDLEDALERDSEFWGYQNLNSSSSRAYEALPSTSSSPPPFILHLAGSLLPLSSSNQSPPVPSSLINVVKIHPSPTYPDFYSLMHEVDLVLPAFARDGYYKSSASSTVPASVIAEVPILATRRLLNAYQYLDSRTSILRPAGMKEIEAVRLLRMGVLPDDYYYSRHRRGARSKREISAEFEDELDDEDEDKFTYGDWDLQLGGEMGEGSASPSVIIELDTNSNLEDDLSTEDSDADVLDEGGQSAITTSTILLPESDASDSNTDETIGIESPQSDSCLHVNGGFLGMGKVSQGETTHPRARARSLLNTHSSRSLRPGAGSLLPRQNPQRGLIPPPQNVPQNTQDRRALEFSRILKKRTFSGEELEEDRHSRRDKKLLDWDGDMNTLTSRAKMRAMQREVYARNEQVLLKAFGG